MSPQLGLIGLGTMGRNLALNLLDHGVHLTVWNLEKAAVDGLLAEATGQPVRAAPTLAALVASLPAPRAVLLMIAAGDPVDSVMAEVVPLLAAGDVLVDCGNSNFHDTRRRAREAAVSGIEFVGLGVSGGAAGARHGPSLMFGGSEEAWHRLGSTLDVIAADGLAGPAAARLGNDGAGHFVKMVHNGIEYGDMQLIAETFDLMQRGAGWSIETCANQFAQWADGELESFLIDTTLRVLRKRDHDGAPLVPKILDQAGQKGTGRWTVATAVDLGVAVPTIAAALDARVVSSHKALRVELGAGRVTDSLDVAADDLERALLAARLAGYAQGLQLLRAGAEAYDWMLDPVRILHTWTGGCIIRARVLEQLMDAESERPGAALPLLQAPGAGRHVEALLPSLRSVVAAGTAAGLPVPALAASLAWYDAWRSAVLPVNLVQAQRDAFGAHGFRRLQGDAEGGPMGDAAAVPMEHATWSEEA